MPPKNPSKPSRSGISLRWSAIGIVVAGCAIALVILLNTERRTPVWADDEPPTSKDDAIAAVERLGGEVRIDGEKPSQPVWSVDFQGSAITAQDLRLLSSFPDLETLNLVDTPLDDEGLQHVAGCQRLKELDLSGTKITDAGLTRLAALEELTTLGLNRTAITDAGLLSLAPLKKLSPPAVFEAQVTDAGLQRLEAAKRETAAPSGKPLEPNPGRQTLEIPKGGMVESQRDLSEMKSMSATNGPRLNQIGKLTLITARGDAPARDRAAEMLERAVQAEPTNDEFKLDLADAYVVLDLELTLALAAELYEDVLRRRPDDQQLLGRVVKAYSALENAPRAYEYAERRLKLIPPAGAYDVALQVVGIIAVGGKLERGLTLMRTAVEKNPDDIGVQLLLATLQIQAKDYADARLTLRKVLDRSPADHPYHEAAGKLLSDMEKDQ